MTPTRLQPMGLCLPLASLTKLRMGASQERLSCSESGGEGVHPALNAHGHPGPAREGELISPLFSGSFLTGPNSLKEHNNNKIAAHQPRNSKLSTQDRLF